MFLCIDFVRVTNCFYDCDYDYDYIFRMQELERISYRSFQQNVSVLSRMTRMKVAFVLMAFRSQQPCLNSLQLTTCFVSDYYVYLV